MKTVIALLFFIAALVPAYAFAINTGDAAPGFSLQDVNGNTVTLNSYKGKVVFLVFWTTWCTTCREELPDLDVLHKKLSGSGFTILSVCVESSVSVITDYIRKHPVSFPVLIDKGGDVAETYRLVGFPVSFILGRDGFIRYRRGGYGNQLLPLYEKEIADALNQ